MACCGQVRAGVSASGGVPRVNRPIRPSARGALYEYTGSTGMTVHGPASGLTYRFGQPGAKVQIDARDAASLVGLPNLRRL